MREISLLISNYLLFIALTCTLAAMQSSLWLHIFGFAPAPYLWLSVMTYWTLYRSLPESVIMCYLSAYVVVTMSGIPLEMAFAVNLSLVGSIYLLRDRVLWSGSNSFMLASGLSAVLLPIFSLIWSHLLEERSISDFHFFDWIMRALLSAAVALPLYYLFSWVDIITQKTAPKDAESSAL